MSSKDTVVIALGGNALLKRDDKGTFEEQFRNVELAAKGIANLIENNYRVVLTHGNGPQVGSTLIRHDAAKKTVPSFPLHACNAETQGFIGYMIVQALQNELDKRRLDKAVVAVVSRVVVDENDPSFKNPTKPIGPYFERSQYANLVNILEGYRLGAKYVNPNVKVMGSYLGDWDSPEKGKEAALLQINSGADLILHVADTSGKGVIEAANEKGVFAFGAVGDQHQLAPKAVLTSFVLDIDKAFDHALRMVAEGRFEGKIFKPGIEAGKGTSGEGIVYLAPFNELDSKVPDDVKARLKQLTQDVIDKKILVPEKYTVMMDPPKVSSESMGGQSKLKVALVTDALFSDGGWGATAFNAAKQLETKYGHEVSSTDNIAISDIESALRSRSNEGYDLIIAHGFQWGDPAVKVGKDYPKTKFVVFTGLVSSGNVASIFPMQQEGTFLLGALAAMMTKTNIIGYVGGDQLDPFISGDSTITWKYQSNAKYRRVVPSPKPVSIVDRHAIRSLIDSGFVVVACGGGGIPVVEKQDGSKFGVDAVIDKDLAGEFLARQIGAKKFVILTDVEGLYLDYKKPSQRLIKEIFLSKDQVEISQLEEGSMGPKVQACLQFVKNGGQEAIIASLDKLQDAVDGLSGTHFFP